MHRWHRAGDGVPTEGIPTPVGVRPGLAQQRPTLPSPPDTSVTHHGCGRRHAGMRARSVTTNTVTVCSRAHDDTQDTTLTVLPPPTPAISTRQPFRVPCVVGGGPETSHILGHVCKASARTDTQR